jgi:hypothetical protein
VEFVVMIGDEGLHPVTKAARFQSFRNFVPKRDSKRYSNATLKEDAFACGTGTTVSQGPCLPIWHYCAERGVALGPGCG